MPAFPRHAEVQYSLGSARSWARCHKCCHHPPFIHTYNSHMFSPWRYTTSVLTCVHHPALQGEQEVILLHGPSSCTLQGAVRKVFTWEPRRLPDWLPELRQLLSSHLQKQLDASTQRPWGGSPQGSGEWGIHVSRGGSPPRKHWAGGCPRSDDLHLHSVHHKRWIIETGRAWRIYVSQKNIIWWWFIFFLATLGQANLSGLFLNKERLLYFLRFC